MLSGGQRARISLARALLNDPDLLILDEASAALDAETEKRIQQSLFEGSNGKKNRITIAVAHRLATIRNADEIISMVDGSIVEEESMENYWKTKVYMLLSGRYKLEKLNPRWDEIGY